MNIKPSLNRFANQYLRRELTSDELSKGESLIAGAVDSAIRMGTEKAISDLGILLPTIEANFFYSLRNEASQK